MQSRLARNRAREQGVFGDPEGFDLPSIGTPSRRQEQTERWAYAFAGVALVAAVAGAFVNAQTKSTVATSLALAAPEAVFFLTAIGLLVARNGRERPSSVVTGEDVSSPVRPAEISVRYSDAEEDDEDFLEIWFPYGEADEEMSAIDLDEIEKIAQVDEQLAGPAMRREAG